MSRCRFAAAAFAVFMLFLCPTVRGEQRFPPPDFVESDYVMPSVDYVQKSQPRRDFLEYLDSFVLIAALAVGAWVVFGKRSRKWIYTLMIFSLIYFGFIRMGCVCSIGAIQNASLSIFGEGYVIPLTVIIFFLAPLVICLFYGRVFCGSVCPLGAIQDFVLIRPVNVPLWLEGPLRLIAYTYLGLAVLFAATGSAFLICRYDPFVAFFRFSGLFNMIVLGVSFLVIGAFVGRPYCRFLCPYGVILRQISRFSSRKVSITPDDCIKCGLCEDACPFNAIEKPTAPWPEEGYGLRKKLLVAALLLLPAVTLLGGYVFSRLSPMLAKADPQVSLAEQIRQEQAGIVTEPSDASRAFRESGQTREQLYAQADAIKEQFRTGAWFAGLFVGFVAGMKLVNYSIQKRRDEYRADPASCLACGRCYQYCPRQHALEAKGKNRGDNNGEKQSGSENG